MLTSITIRNFKSYHEATLPLAPLTLLIGANASGKSNAIEAIRFLSWLARGQRLTALQYQIQASDLAIRGNTRDLFSHGNASFSFVCRFSGALENLDAEELSLTIGQTRNELIIENERLSSPRRKVPLYEINEPELALKPHVKVSYENVGKGGDNFGFTGTNQQAIFTQLRIFARSQGTLDSAQFAVTNAAVLVSDNLQNIVFLDPEPRSMRNYVQENEVLPREDGSNVSAMLKALWQHDSHRDQLLAFIRSLPEQNIARLDFITTGLGDVMVQLVETFGGGESAVAAPLLSDGTLRVLSIAAVLMSAPEASMVVIEEIDNGVHPSRAHQLMSSIQEVAKERRLRVLLTTHNPALMDALPIEALADVVFCYRDPEGGDSRLVRLSDLADYPQLMAQGDLGELVTAGIVDRVVKQQVDPEEKKKRALEWLEGLRTGTGA